MTSTQPTDRDRVLLVLRGWGPCTLTRLHWHTRLSRLRLRIALWRLERAGLVVARKGVPTIGELGWLLCGRATTVEWVWEIVGGEHEHAE